ncbi:MAG TPA: hypothetical protein VH208_06345, partial [Myxococcaceae bacterium]|nr:hypothetical protein [Myxococcaceae bacterium]
DLGEFLGELDLLPDGKHFMEVGQGDLSDRYIGGAVQNTKDIHNRAKGGVLFTDEAYAVMGANRGMGGGPDPYGKQIIDEFVRFSTHPEYMGKMAWVYAGYKAPMQDFFKNNEGFANRVKHIIEMEAPDQNACVEMFLKFGERENVHVSEEALQVVDKVIGKMRGPKFGNGRDIENLYKKAVRRSIVNGTYTDRQISAKDAAEAGEEMLKDMAQTRGGEEKKN